MYTIGILMPKMYVHMHMYTYDVYIMLVFLTCLPGPNLGQTCNYKWAKMGCLWKRAAKFRPNMALIGPVLTQPHLLASN